MGLIKDITSITLLLMIILPILIILFYWTYLGIAWIGNEKEEYKFMWIFTKYNLFIWVIGWLGIFIWNMIYTRPYDYGGIVGFMACLIGIRMLMSNIKRERYNDKNS